VAPQLSGVGPQVESSQGSGAVHCVVVVVEVVVVVVVVVVSQTVPAPHTPEQQSESPRQPWSPLGMQPTHMPVVMSQSDMLQVPQEPPQPSAPQFLCEQFGVQAGQITDPVPEFPPVKFAPPPPVAPPITDFLKFSGVPA